LKKSIDFFTRLVLGEGKKKPHVIVVVLLLGFYLIVDLINLSVTIL